MLDSLAQELTGIEQAEFPLADRINALLERENLSPISVSAYTDQTGRLTVEAAIPPFKLARMNQTSMTLCFPICASEGCSCGGERSGKRIPSAVDREEPSIRWKRRKFSIPVTDRKCVGMRWKRSGTAGEEFICFCPMEWAAEARAALDSAMTVCLLKKAGKRRDFLLIPLWS